ncbi:MAG: phosphoenolpyruvate carboxykinase (ATP) [Planctomycetes bacterium]|nr:phosphoenolpyruvate carboxykinase (ATP) [Planctomycetota bacterium]
MVDLKYVGIAHPAHVYHNLSTPALYEEAIRRREGWLSHLGPLVVRTGHYTGRSANDKFIVQEPSAEKRVWWGKHNKPISEQNYNQLKIRLQAYLQGRDIFVQDCYSGADPAYRMKVRVITETAWHNLFARTMFIREFDPQTIGNFDPDFTVIHCPNFSAMPEYDGTNSEAFVILNLAQKTVIIGGTSYAGEIKKSIFTVMNFLLPQRSVLSMHCSANIGAAGDTAVFFGLSGTGKTTLSSEKDRAMIGDDEHGWSERGVFNLEGGCYAKVIKLNPEAEPEIYATTRRFGTLLENVAFDLETRRVNLDDAGMTENTRAAYPITHMPNVVKDGVGGHPRNIVMLTCDAFGVMPPIARLTPEQAMYHFISGYTAKVAGTERGVKEPAATFSACFGAPFMALHPAEYAGLLGKLMANHRANCWLVNTGWSGGAYGVGQRMQIGVSRAVVRAALSGALNDAAFTPDPVFRFGVPSACPGVSAEILQARHTWPDKAAYDAKARELAGLFKKNFQEFEAQVPKEIAAAGPA